MAARNLAEGIQIFLQTGALQACLLQILCGANKRTWFAPDGSANRAERSSSFGSQQDQSLLRLLWHRDEDSLLPNGFVPCIDVGEPEIRRRVRGPPQKGNNHHIVHRLAIGQISMYPQPISRLQIRYLGDRQSNARSLHPYLNLGTKEIKGSSIRAQKTSKREQE